MIGIGSFLGEGGEKRLSLGQGGGEARHKTQLKKEEKRKGGGCEVEWHDPIPVPITEVGNLPT